MDSLGSSYSINLSPGPQKPSPKSLRTNHLLKPKLLLKRVAQAKVDNLDALALVEKPWHCGILGLRLKGFRILGFKGLGVWASAPGI